MIAVHFTQNSNNIKSSLKAPKMILHSVICFVLFKVSIKIYCPYHYELHAVLLYLWQMLPVSLISSIDTLITMTLIILSIKIGYAYADLAVIYDYLGIETPKPNIAIQVA